LNSTPTPSFSSVNTANKITYVPFFNISGYNYASSTLIDILSKREYLYRAFLKNKSLSLLIPEFFTASVNSKLLIELKSLFMYVDPITFRSELQRELLFKKSMLLRHDMSAEISKVFTSLSYSVPLNLKCFNAALMYYLVIPNTNLYTDISSKEFFFKSHYKPMRKGITNMVRLQATNAIAMPTELRLHILASSKDVIHS
jgi:hypothetical protein